MLCYSLSLSDSSQGSKNVVKRRICRLALTVWTP